MFLPGSRLTADSLNKGLGYPVSKFRTARPKGAEHQSSLTIPVVCAVKNLPAYSPVLIIPAIESLEGVYGIAHSFEHAQNLAPLVPYGQPIVGIIQESAAGNRIINAVIYGVTKCRTNPSNSHYWDTFGWIPGCPAGVLCSCPGGYLKKLLWNENFDRELYFLNPGITTVFTGTRHRDNSLICNGFRFTDVLYCGSVYGSNNRRHQLVITSDISRGTLENITVSGFIKW